MESGVCGCVSEFDIAGTGAVYIKAYGETLCFFLPDPRAHDQSRRQKTALVQAEIRKTVKRSVQLTSSRVRLGQSFKTVGYGCASCWGDVGAGSVEADIIYILFIVSVQYIGY